MKVALLRPLAWILHHPPPYGWFIILGGLELLVLFAHLLSYVLYRIFFLQRTHVNSAA